MGITLANNAHTTLAANISSTDTTIYVDDVDSFPALDVGDYFYCTIESTTGTYEIVKVTQINATSFEVVRGQESTIAVPFNIGARVELRLTVQNLEDFLATGSNIHDDAYSSSWNGDTTDAASRNAIYDKFESLAQANISGLTTTSEPEFAGINLTSDIANNIDLDFNRGSSNRWKFRTSATSNEFVVSNQSVGNVMTIDYTTGLINLRAPISNPTIEGSAILKASDIGSTVQAYDADLTTLGAGGSAARSFLGLAIGTDVQAYDADLTTLGAGGFAARSFLGLGSADTVTFANIDLDSATNSDITLNFNEQGFNRWRLRYMGSSGDGLLLLNQSGGNVLLIDYPTSVVRFYQTPTVNGTAIATLGGGTFTGDISVPDEAYGVGWDGSVEVPTKNAIYDKIQSLSTLSDGDKGDITVSASGATWTIDNGAVTLGKMADMATASLIYRKTAGTGAPEVNTLATLKTDLGLTGTNSGDQTITLTGDVTGSGTGSFAATIANNAVTLAKMATMATDSILGRATAATGNVEVLTALPFAFTGDVTRPADSNVQTIANDAVTYAKMQNVSAQYRLLGRSSSGAGDVEEITSSANMFSLLGSADYATARTNLGLTALATTTPGTGVATFLATPSSANLASAVTDETGSGSLVFATSPTLVTPTLGVATATSMHAPPPVSSETTGALTSASRNKIVQCSGNITLPASGMSDGDSILIDPRGTARTITRPAAHTMYISNTDSATGTTGAHNVVTAVYHGSSKWTVQGSVT